MRIIIEIDEARRAYVSVYSNLVQEVQKLVDHAHWDGLTNDEIAEALIEVSHASQWSIEPLVKVGATWDTPTQHAAIDGFGNPLPGATVDKRHYCSICGRYHPVRLVK